MRKIIGVLSFLATLVLLMSACVAGFVVPLPDRVDEETDANGDVTGVYEVYEGENTTEEVFKEVNDQGEMVLKWVQRTEFNDEKNPIEERFTHNGLISWIKNYTYNGEVSSRNGEPVREIEYRNGENELEHREEYTYDLLGRLIRIDHWDVFSGVETKTWHTVFVYEGETSEPVEERDISDHGYVNEDTGDGTMGLTRNYYDDNGNIIEKNISYDGVTFPDVFIYMYDELGRLISEECFLEGTFAWEKRYTYEGETLRSIELLDGEGNLLKKKTFG